MENEENLLKLSVEDLFAQLHQALLQRELWHVRRVATAVEQHWVFAVVHRDRSKIRAMADALLRAASTAATRDGEGFPGAAFEERWLTLAETADLILVVDTAGTAVEDRERLKRFEHAEAVIGFLNRKRIAALSDVQGFLGGEVTTQACWNHVNRLVKLGLVMRVSDGIYGLSPSGQEVAQLLAGEKEKIPLEEKAASRAAPRSGSKGGSRYFLQTRAEVVTFQVVP